MSAIYEGEIKYEYKIFVKIKYLNITKLLSEKAKGESYGC